MSQILLGICRLLQADLIIDPDGRLAGINGPLAALCSPIHLGQRRIGRPEQGLGLGILLRIALHPIDAQGLQGGINGLLAALHLLFRLHLQIGQHAGGYGQILVAAGQLKGLAELQGRLEPLPGCIQGGRAVLLPILYIGQYEMGHP